MNRAEAKRLGASIFLNAAAYIRKYGWQKQGMGKDKHPRCSMGALASAYPKRKWDENLSATMYSALTSELHGMTLTEFNYKYGDGGKVAKLFERTAYSLDRSNGR